MDEEKIILQPSERALMEELWRENPQTITQLYHALEEKCGWTKSTVSTMLKRMTEKGLLRYEQGTKAKNYFPTVEQSTVNYAETQSFLSRVYQGSVSMMMSTLLKQRKLSAEELQELYDMLQETEEES